MSSGGKQLSEQAVTMLQETFPKIPKEYLSSVASDAVIKVFDNCVQNIVKVDVALQKLKTKIDAAVEEAKKQDAECKEFWHTVYTWSGAPLKVYNNSETQIIKTALAEKGGFFEALSLLMNHYNQSPTFPYRLELALSRGKTCNYEYYGGYGADFTCPAHVIHGHGATTLDLLFVKKEQTLAPAVFW